MSRAQHPSSRELHDEHAERRALVRAMERRERHAAQRSLIRALRAMVQPHEPHSFHPCPVSPSPRQTADHLAAPGGPDPTDFCPGGIC